MERIVTYCRSAEAMSSEILLVVGDGSKVENRDGSKVNWDNLHGKMSEDVGPYKIGRLFKDPEF